MDYIFIKNIRYIHSTIYTTNVVPNIIEVDFDFGFITDSKIMISINDIGEISDQKIREYIVKHMNSLLERKYIDEI